MKKYFTITTDPETAEKVISHINWLEKSPNDEPSYKLRGTTKGDGYTTIALEPRNEQIKPDEIFFLGLLSANFKNVEAAAPKINWVRFYEYRNAIGRNQFFRAEIDGTRVEKQDSNGDVTYAIGSIEEAEKPFTTEEQLMAALTLKTIEA